MVGISGYVHQPERLVISGAGAVDHQATTKVVDSFFGARKNGAAKPALGSTFPKPFFVAIISLMLALFCEM